MYVVCTVLLTAAVASFLIAWLAGRTSSTWFLCSALASLILEIILVARSAWLPAVVLTPFVLLSLAGAMRRKLSVEEAQLVERTMAELDK
ncbi:MAG: hypothetical protein AKCLJLPJ_00771 [Fimbriimonadales bacterium]|nr:hypothetical protein [Fimbriimonadales bacterium]